MGAPENNTRVFEVTPPPSDSENESENESENNDNLNGHSMDTAGLVVLENLNVFPLFPGNGADPAGHDNNNSDSDSDTDDDSDSLISTALEEHENEIDAESNSETDTNSANPDQEGINWDKLCTTWLLLNNMQCLDMNGLNTALLEEEDLLRMQANCEGLLQHMGATMDTDVPGLLTWPNLDIDRFILAHDLLNTVVQWSLGPFCDFYTHPDCTLQNVVFLSVFLASCGLTVFAHRHIGGTTRRLCLRIGGPEFEDKRPQFHRVSPMATVQ